MPESLFNKVEGLRPATLLKKRLWRRCFPVNVAKFLRTPFVSEHLWWLLLQEAAKREDCKSISFFVCVIIVNCAIIYEMFFLGQQITFLFINITKV